MYIEVNNQELEIPFFRIDKIQRTHKPIYCALIGENGTYKTEILRALSVHYAKLRTKSFVTIKNRSKDRPRKVVACSSSPFCKFPTTRSTFSKLNKSYDSLEAERYTYIGIKSSSNIQNRLYDLLLRASVAALNENRMDIIRKALHLIGIEDELLFKFKLRTADEKFSPMNGRLTDQQKIDAKKFMNSKKFKKYFSNPNGGFFQLKFLGRVDSDLDTDFFVNLEALRKMGYVSLTSVTVKESGDGVNGVLDLVGISSGRSSLIQSLIGLASSVEDNALLLIDEPEISLHPNLQIQFMTFVDEIVSSFKNVKVILATHSPHVISSLPNDRSQVLRLAKRENLLNVKLIPQSVSGWSADDLLFDVFGLGTARSLSFQNNFMVIAEMISGTREFNESEFAEAYHYIENLDLPTNDSMKDLLIEAKSFLEG